MGQSETENAVEVICLTYVFKFSLKKLCFIKNP